MNIIKKVIASGRELFKESNWAMKVILILGAIGIVSIIFSNLFNIIVVGAVGYGLYRLSKSNRIKKAISSGRMLFKESNRSMKVVYVLAAIGVVLLFTFGNFIDVLIIGLIGYGLYRFFSKYRIEKASE